MKAPEAIFLTSRIGTGGRPAPILTLDKAFFRQLLCTV